MWKNSQRDHQHYYPKKYDDAIHLFYTNIEVNGHNVYMLNSLEEMLEEIAANLLLPKGYRPKTDTGLIDKTQFAEILKLKKSARVMIIANVDIKDSIGILFKNFTIRWSLLKNQLILCLSKEFLDLDGDEGSRAFL